MPAYSSDGNYCAPDSIAMLLGYWDVHNGYSSLFPGPFLGSSPGNGQYLTSNANVQSVINTLAGPNYCNTDYSSGTAINNVIPSIKNYAALFGGYNFNASLITPSSISSAESTLANNINAGNPMIFYIDSNGDGIVDHLAPVFGYETIGANSYYATYTSEDESPIWILFQKVKSGNIGGVYQEIQITPQATPEPTTLSLAILGGALSLILLRKRHHFL